MSEEKKSILKKIIDNTKHNKRRVVEHTDPVKFSAAHKAEMDSIATFKAFPNNPKLYQSKDPQWQTNLVNTIIKKYPGQKRYYPNIDFVNQHKVNPVNYTSETERIDLPGAPQGGGYKLVGLYNDAKIHNVLKEKPIEIPKVEEPKVETPKIETPIIPLPKTIIGPSGKPRLATDYASPVGTSNVLKGYQERGNTSVKPESIFKQTNNKSIKERSINLNLPNINQNNKGSSFVYGDEHFLGGNYNQPVQGGSVSVGINSPTKSFDPTFSLELTRKFKEGGNTSVKPLYKKMIRK